MSGQIDSVSNFGLNLNRSALAQLPFVESRNHLASRGVSDQTLPCGARVLDFGVKTCGSLRVGTLLANLCMAGLGDVSLVPGQVDGIGVPTVQVQTDNPVEACLLSQYAGWRVSVGDYFGMGSGPMRAAAAREELFEKLPWDESPDAVLGVLASEPYDKNEYINSRIELAELWNSAYKD